MSNSNEREEHIFARAVSIPAGERARFLDAECAGDAALRERVESLLKAHDSAGDFMASPVAVPIDDPSPHLRGVVESAGTRIGRYKLLQKIGEGGCGVVWMAEQEEPVRRQVALKIIKLGMDTREVIARFEAERQALAMLDHPNIAKILDAGATETGRPYFVMELVRGIKITEFCDRYNLSTTQRLELFSEVCNAVQHAHQKGIIHRDLKPSNILVTLDGSTPVPKVIDFGIAKATTGRLTDHTLFTAFEQFIGTPSYMSPEQAELSGVDVDTRSDIYSLGVLLYELLTGRLPFDPKTLLQAGLDEIRRIIREVEPPKPSTNLSTLGDSDRAHVAKARSTDPTRLSLLLKGDLDWIVMCCLEKNRTRRYATPNALAADIARHLNNEPVIARPASRLYRLDRLIRRNRLEFAALIVVSLVLIAGAVISTYQAVRATKAERVAQSERAAAVLERSRAEDLLKFMLGDLYTQLDKVGRLEVLDSVADKASSYFASIGAGDLNDTTKLARARALRLVGGVRMAQARYSDALAAFTEADLRSSELAARNPNNPEILFERGQAEFGIGNVHWSRGELGEAGSWLTRYRDTCARLVEIEPSRIDRQLDLSDGQRNLASLDERLGHHTASKAEFLKQLLILQKMEEADPENPEVFRRLADCRDWLGRIAEQLGNLSEARQDYTLELAVLEKLSAADPTTISRKLAVAAARTQLIVPMTILGDYAAATREVAQNKALLSSLVERDQENVEWKAYAFDADLFDALLASATGNDSEALRRIRAIGPALEAAVAREPSNRNLAKFFISQMESEAELRSVTGAGGAVELAEKANVWADKLFAPAGASVEETLERASARVTLGDVSAADGDGDSAKRAWSSALELLGPSAGDSRYWRILDPYVRAKAGLGQFASARSAAATLKDLGYVPIKPWPDLTGSGAAKDPAQQNR